MSLHGHIAFTFEPDCSIPMESMDYITGRSLQFKVLSDLIISSRDRIRPPHLPAQCSVHFPTSPPRSYTGAVILDLT